MDLSDAPEAPLTVEQLFAFIGDEIAAAGLQVLGTEKDGDFTVVRIGTMGEDPRRVTSLTLPPRYLIDRGCEVLPAIRGTIQEALHAIATEPALRA